MQRLSVMVAVAILTVPDELALQSLAMARPERTTLVENCKVSRTANTMAKTLRRRRQQMSGGRRRRRRRQQQQQSWRARFQSQQRNRQMTVATGTATGTVIGTATGTASLGRSMLKTVGM